MGQATDLQSIAIVIGLWIPWGGALLWAIKWLLGRYMEQIEGRLTTLEAGLQARHQEWQRVERTLLELKAELPVQYLRKEDAIRMEVTINAKLDAVARKLDELGGRHG